MKSTFKQINILKNKRKRMVNGKHYVVVTGSNGMVGTALKRKVSERTMTNTKEVFEWVWTTREDLDLLDYDMVVKFLGKYNSDRVTVINLAANVGGLFKNMNQNLDMLDSNLTINLNLLKATKQLNISRVINILSTCIFPDKVQYPLLEEYINRGEPHMSNSGYAYAKRVAQIYTTLVNESSNHFKYVNFIPTNLYGKMDNYNIRDAHVIPAIIHKCVKMAKDKQVSELTLPGDGEPERMFLYDEDFANVIIDFVCHETLRTYKGDYIVSGNSEKSIKIRDLATIIESKVGKVLDYDIRIKFENDTYGNGQHKKPCSNAKLSKTYTNEDLMLPIKDDNMSNNLDDVIEWFVTNYDTYHRK